MTLDRFQSLRRAVLAQIMTLTLLVLLVVRSSGQGDFHEYVEAFGLALMAAGVIGRMWCTLYIGGRKSAEIVAHGPYSISRNPLYVFSTIAIGGVGAQTGSILVAIGLMLGCAALFHIVIRREERHLTEIFGESYRAYLRSTPRFWPRFGRFADAPQLTISTGRLYRTLSDGLLFFLAIPAFELIEQLQRIAVLPVLFHLP